jgi:hypothetical protein
VRGNDRLSRSRRQEREGMQRFGGVQNPRSGARWDRKNDGRTDTELVEFKRTDNRRSITLLYDDLRALRRHAVVEGRVPLLCFELAGEHFVVLPENDYHELAARRLSPAAYLRERTARLVSGSQVSGDVRTRTRQSLLRRSSAQRSGQRGQVSVPRNPSRLPRPLPGARPLSGVRPRERREVGRLGRVQRKGAAGDQTSTAS